MRRILLKAGLGRENIKRVKAITRFEASYPNEMWQTDIMGKIAFRNLGILYLIATLDDHSRFVPAGKWFRTQGKMNVFQIWYESLSKCGLPDAMLQDEGSQYKARTRFGTADYEWYAKQAGIELKWAKSAECKGKIERFWKFVQGDFVPEVINAKTPEDIFEFAQSEKRAPLTEAEQRELKRRIDYAAKIIRERPVSLKPPFVIDGEQQVFLTNLLHLLAQVSDWNGESLRDAVYEAKNQTSIESKRAFQSIYRVLLGTEAGPKVGDLMVREGREHVLERLAGVTMNAKEPNA